MRRLRELAQQAGVELPPAFGRFSRSNTDGQVNAESAISKKPYDSKRSAAWSDAYGLP